MFDNCQYDESRELITDTTQKLGSKYKNLFKSSDELLNLMAIHEMHIETECSKAEDAQASIIIALADMFDII